MARPAVAHAHDLARTPGRVWCSTCPLDVRWTLAEDETAPPDFGGFGTWTWTPDDDGR